MQSEELIYLMDNDAYREITGFDGSAIQHNSKVKKRHKRDKFIRVQKY